MTRTRKILNCLKRFCRLLPVYITAIRDYPNDFPYTAEWFATRMPGKTPLKDQQPWITFRARDWLVHNCQTSWKVLEWGSGGSTLFFATRAGQIVTIEHDPSWFTQVSAALQQISTAKVEMHLVPPIKCDNEPVRAYLSGLPQFKGYSFREYVHCVTQYPLHYFDLIIVDGRARMGCLEIAVNYLAPGGFLLLDNAEYPRYSDFLRRFQESTVSKWHFRDFSGLGGYTHTVGVTRTIGWRRPTFS